MSKPLALIFQTSLVTGCLPSDWKSAIITPLFKGGSRASVNNYRPVSLTSICCKIMDKIIKKALMQFLEQHHLLSDAKHGFRSGTSCLRNLLFTLERWTKARDEGNVVHANYIDFKKAFDSVPHQCLLHKLRNVGIRGRLLVWIQSFLSGRSQRVQVGRQQSSDVSVVSGVQQGSVIGPTLFLVLINDCAKDLDCDAILFADNIKLWKAGNLLYDPATACVLTCRISDSDAGTFVGSVYVTATIRFLTCRTSGCRDCCDDHTFARSKLKCSCVCVPHGPGRNCVPFSSSRAFARLFSELRPKGLVGFGKRYTAVDGGLAGVPSVSCFPGHAIISSAQDFGTLESERVSRVCAVFCHQGQLVHPPYGLHVFSHTGLESFTGLSNISLIAVAARRPLQYRGGGGWVVPTPDRMPAQQALGPLSHISISKATAGDLSPWYLPHRHGSQETRGSTEKKEMLPPERELSLPDVSDPHLDPAPETVSDSGSGADVGKNSSAPLTNFELDHEEEEEEKKKKKKIRRSSVTCIETMNYLCDVIRDTNYPLGMPVETLKELLTRCTQNVQFLYNGQLYRQIDGVAMGSPFGPFLANVFMGKVERTSLQDTIDGLKFYGRLYFPFFFLTLCPVYLAETIAEKFGGRQIPDTGDAPPLPPKDLQDFKSPPSPSSPSPSWMPKSVQNFRQKPTTKPRFSGSATMRTSRSGTRKPLITNTERLYQSIQELERGLEDGKMSARQLLGLLISLHLSIAYAAVLYPWTYADFMDTRGMTHEDDGEVEHPSIAKRPFYNPWADYSELISKLQRAHSNSLKRLSKRPFFNPFVFRNRTPE
ncbi:hypothetical protein SprV_0200947000 [Sparganum proliferum]